MTSFGEADFLATVAVRSRIDAQRLMAQLREGAGENVLVHFPATLYGREFRLQFPAYDAARAATRHFARAGFGGTVAGVPGETATDRRRRVIAANVRRFRETRGLSQPQLALIIGVDRIQISRWEGAHREPSAEHIEALALALDVPTHEFYREEIAA